MLPVTSLHPNATALICLDNFKSSCHAYRGALDLLDVGLKKMEARTSSIEYSMIPHYCSDCQRRSLCNVADPRCGHCNSTRVIAAARQSEEVRRAPHLHHDVFSSFPHDVFSMFDMFPSMLPRDMFFEGFRMFDRGFSRRQTSLFDRLFESDGFFSTPPFMRSFFNGPNVSGMDFETLLRHAASQQQGGPPPASEASISSLPTLKLTQEQLEHIDKCTICQDNFTVGEQVNQLRCEHIFHPDCIVPWLKIRNTCPTCRQPVS